MPLVELETLVKRIPDGALLAVPPDYSGVAMAAARALIRRGVRDLHLLAVPTSGLQADLLIGAGAVATLEAAAVSLGEWGPAPRFVAAVKAGALAIKDSTCPAIHAGLQAAEKGIPFMPLRGLLGSDLMRHRDDWRVIDNPLAAGGEPDPIVVLPAITPDVALFHAPLGDRSGNVWVGRRRELATLAHAARELLIATIARRLRGARHIAVGAASPIPAAAALLAQALSEGGTRVSLLGSREHNFFTDGGRELFDCAAQGRIDAFFLGGGEIDGEANVNLVGVGGYPASRVRFAGSYGSAYLYFLVPNVILFREEHSPRTLVERVAFISAPGTSPKGLPSGRPTSADHRARRLLLRPRRAPLPARQRPSRPQRGGDRRTNRLRVRSARARSPDARAADLVARSHARAHRRAGRRGLPPVRRRSAGTRGRRGRGEPLNTAQTGTGALAGWRVVDLSRILGGPLCGQILGDHGAEVIKVEPPHGDDTRGWGPPFQDGESAYYTGLNRNKRSISLDLSRAQGREVLLRLLEGADVLLDNFKIGTMEGWGLGYEEVLKERFPRLIYCRISGFGADGPYGGLPGYDGVAQALSGLMSVNGTPQSGPTRIGVALVDQGTGMMAAIAVLAAAQERTRSGLGQFIEATLFDTGVSLLHPYAYNWFMSNKPPVLTGNEHANVVPYNKFETATGPIFLTAANDRQFRRLCHEIGEPDLAEDARFLSNADRVANRAALAEALAGALEDRNGEAVCKALLAVGIAAGPVLDTPAVLNHPHTRHRDMVVEIDGYRGTGIPVKLSRTPGSVRRAPPRFGDSGRAVLAEAGYGAAEIEALVEAGVLVETRRTLT